MLKELDDYDWKEAFKYAQPDRVPGATVSGDTFTRDNVAEIAGLALGDNDGPDWIVYGRLADGRWFSLAAGCDYTGWG
jgi:hypothetical protein